MRLFFYLILFSLTTVLAFAECVDTYDTGENENSNDSYPGVTISELNHITTTTNFTICGVSLNDDSSHKEDYYNFTIDTEGYLSIAATSKNKDDELSDFYLEVYVNDEVVYPEEKEDTHYVNLNIQAGDKVVLYFKESGSSDDYYTASFTFSDEVMQNGGDRPFTVRNPEETRNISGNYAIIGNANECALHTKEEDAPWTGDCYESTSNSRPARYIDIDGDSSTKNSSASTLNIANFQEHQAKVVWAGLYWQGVVHNSVVDGDFMGTSGYANGQTIENEPVYDTETQINFAFSSSTYDAEKIKFKIPGGDYQELEADVFDYYKLGYSAFKDITDIINVNNPNGEYFVADIKANQGKESKHGNYASWAIVVIYEDAQEGYKNITLFDGYATVDSSFDQDLLIKGFLTPRTPPIESKLAVFAMDGDNGDNSLTIVNQAGEATDVENQDNPGDSLFDSTISQSIIRTPDATSLRTDLKVLNLVDVLNPLETEAILQPRSGGDRYTPSFFIMSADLFVPKFCYDYAYKQEEIYFTEKNDGTKKPRIVGTVQKDEPIQVKVYIRNQVESDIDISDMNVSILDINTSQAVYIRHTTELAKDGNIIASPVDDNQLSVSDSYIKNIQIGTISSNDFFYIYYQLNPEVNDLNISLNVQANYLLSVDGGDPIPYTLTLGNDPENIKMCSSANFKYQPARGIFNIVHNDYYDFDNGGTKRYYNLPTQVSSRVGNFKVTSMDPENLDNLKATSTIVAVDMIDASAFHDTNTSCTELSSAITKRVWVQIGNQDNNATSAPLNKDALNSAIAAAYTDLNTPEEFYKTARQNTAFRISFNAMDENGTIPYISKVNNGASITLNWREEWTGEDCKTPMGDTGVSEDVRNKTATYCNATKNTFNLKECMECIYGIHTRVICSRDNFAIRPEAFLMQIDDQNQDDFSQQIDITTLTDSGANESVTPNLNLAAGYKYNLEVNATNHLNHNATPGYTRTFNLDNTARAVYLWAPPMGHDVSGCNDTNDINTSMRFLNGKVDTNTSLQNVGRYILSIYDTSWTDVDHNPAFMTHHTGSYYTSTLDCRVDSDIVLDTNATMDPNDATTLNGCNITSNHTNNEAHYNYNNYPITFHPYAFDMSDVQPSVGLDRNTAALSATNYIYYADITQNSDENMSYHLDGDIVAIGRDHNKTTNFVDACYAVPLNLTLTTLNSREHQDINEDNLPYMARFHILNSNDDDAVIVTARDVTLIDAAPETPLVIQTTAAHFLGDLNGTMITRTNFNYQRQKDTPANPFVLNFVDYNATCSNAADCRFSANLTTLETNGTKDLNSSQAIRHYYGRTHNPRQSFTKADATVNYTDAEDIIYYEVYCSDSATSDCNKTLLQDGNNSQFSDDPRWFINTQHESNFGVPGTATQKGGSDYVTEIDDPDAATGNAIHEDGKLDYFHLRYNGDRGYPYRTTMENNASGWLIYNRYNAAATTNSWDIDFINATGNWAGKTETDSTTKRNAADMTNRRTLW